MELSLQTGRQLAALKKLIFVLSKNGNEQKYYLMVSLDCQQKIVSTSTCTQEKSVVDTVAELLYVLSIVLVRIRTAEC